MKTKVWTAAVKNAGLTTFAQGCGSRAELQLFLSARQLLGEVSWTKMNRKKPNLPNGMCVWSETSQ